MAEHYDVIIIGTGAGGGTLAHQLAHAGKKILILERGTFLPREKENWDTTAVFEHNRYHTKEVWSDKDGKPLHPGTGYWVGGNTKVYGAAMFRLREKDFHTLQHKGGISPEWPLKYDVFEPFYTRAEELYCVHGRSGLDPTEPWRSKQYPFPPISDEPRLQAIDTDMSKIGMHPFPVPLGLKLNEQDRTKSACIRCDTCDGFPCMVHAKADADIDCVRPVHEMPNVTLRTSARVRRVLTNPTGTAATGVEVDSTDGTAPQTYEADVVVVACGAINSAFLLLSSANDSHPEGLANRSGMVGRHFMFHNSIAMLAITLQRNEDAYMKTFGINDFYFSGGEDYPFPLGSVQPVGSLKEEMMKGDAPPLTPGFVLHQMREHAVPWWLMTEDLPDPDNRVTIADGAVRLNYTPNNQESFNKLYSTWAETLTKAGHRTAHINLHKYFKKTINLEGVGHQNGTCRFGEDPGQSVLDLNCQTHDVQNLYVVDGSFFPSCGAVNPSLTIIANAIRVADHLIDKLK